jgi:hypothetical protein
MLAIVQLAIKILDRDAFKSFLKFPEWVCYLQSAWEWLIYMQDSDRRPVSNRRPILKSASNSQIYGCFSLSQIDVQ